MFYTIIRRRNNLTNIHDIANEFIDLLNDFHSLPEVYDNELDAQLHRWYAEVENVWPQRPYFSPSAIGSCKREIYMKQVRAKKDGFRQPPHRGRWTRLGTNVGSMIQRDLLIIERQYERLSGKAPRFRFEKDAQGRPAFEDFAKVNKRVQHRGHTFYLYGNPDGIMEYITEDGEILRIGLEIKSKQGTAAKTSEYSMREAEAKHVKQCASYAEMYGVDYYIVLYVNCSKKGWFMTPEDFEKTPDIRAFGVEITPDMKTEIFDYCADVLDAVKAKTPPPLEPNGWVFNNFKTACALSLTDEEFAELKAYVKRVQRSNLRDSDKQQALDMYYFIEEVRANAKGHAN